MPDKYTIKPVSKLRGCITPPGDKSISHRALMLGSLAEGITTVNGFLRGQDCLSTLSALKSLGVEIEDCGDKITVVGRGLYGLKEAEDVLDMGNSGTSLRLLCGMLAAQGFFSVCTGDNSLRKRPMRRVVEPLTLMGAKIWGRRENNLAPLAIQGTDLKAIQYTLKQASAQVKSAVLLAGLFAYGTTQVTEPAPTRDHTERMLKAMGADITSENLTVTLEGRPCLKGLAINVPADFSAAAFFIVAALIVPDSRLTIKNVGLNHTRTGLLEVIKHMGGEIEVMNQRYEGHEKVGDLLVKSSRLKGVTIQGDLVPRMIDEFPVMGILAAAAEGPTLIREAAELRLKESDRISCLAEELRKAGVVVEEYPDGMKIEGNAKLKGAVFNSHGDHRLAMSMAIGALIADSESKVEGLNCVQTSFPNFFELLEQISVY